MIEARIDSLQTWIKHQIERREKMLALGMKPDHPDVRYADKLIRRYKLRLERALKKGPHTKYLKL